MVLKSICNPEFPDPLLDPEFPGTSLFMVLTLEFPNASHFHFKFRLEYYTLIFHALHFQITDFDGNNRVPPPPLTIGSIEDHLSLLSYGLP